MVAEKKIELLTGPVCTVKVGPNKESFSIHEKLISSCSPFFDTALAGPWKEASEHSVKLPEDEPEIFTLYVRWLYSGQINPLSDQAGLNKITGDKLKLTGNELRDHEYTQLFKACFLADKLLDTGFHDAVIRAILSKLSRRSVLAHYCLPGATPIAWLFNKAQTSTQVRRLVIDAYAKEGRSQCFTSSDVNKIPTIFYRLLAESLMDKRATPPNWTLKPEDYFSTPASLKRKR
ncbi:unnamed protein product [Penicillium bialowiezense]